MGTHNRYYVCRLLLLRTELSAVTHKLCAHLNSALCNNILGDSWLIPHSEMGIRTSATFCRVIMFIVCASINHDKLFMYRDLHETWIKARPLVHVVRWKRDESLVIPPHWL